VAFLPDSGDDRRASGEIMIERPRRNHTGAFKAKVALAALKCEELCGKMGDDVRKAA
jgi:hypothetical protein